MPMELNLGILALQLAMKALDKRAYHQLCLHYRPLDSQNCGISKYCNY